MNGDIATAAAWTPEDRRAQQTNMALNKLDAALHLALVEHPYDFGSHVFVTPQLIQAQSRRRLRKCHIALARVAAELTRIEAQS